VRYTVRVGAVETVVDVVEKKGRTFVAVAGREMAADLTAIRGKVAYALRLGGRTRTVCVGSRGDGPTVTVGAREFRVAVEDERERAAHAVRPARGDGPRVLRSVMPGIVRDVLVAEGDAVEARVPLLVLEAMKMQNEVRADRAGTVAAVHVAPGTTVARGDALVTLR